MVLYGHINRIVYYGALRPHKPSALLWCFTSTETVCFIMVLYVHSNRILYYGALSPQKPYGLLGTGEERDGEWEPWPTSLFIQLQNSATATRMRLPLIKVGDQWRDRFDISVHVGGRFPYLRTSEEKGEPNRKAQEGDRREECTPDILH